MRRCPPAWGIAIALLGGGVWACGEGDAGEPTFVAEEDFAGALAASECAALFDCDCPDVRWDDRSDCREGMRQRHRDESFVADMHGLQYDGACVADLIVRRQHLDCQISPAQDASEQEWAAASCAVPCKPYYGPGREAEACERFGATVSIDDCGRGLTCTNRICTPMCNTAAPLTVGQKCLAGIEELGTCAQGSFCDEGTQRCVLAPILGESCETRCGPGAWCDRVPDPPVCVELGIEGAACALGESCLSGTCENQACTIPAALVCS